MPLSAGMQFLQGTQGAMPAGALRIEGGTLSYAIKGSFLDKTVKSYTGELLNKKNQGVFEHVGKMLADRKYVAKDIANDFSKCIKNRSVTVEDLRNFIEQNKDKFDKPSPPKTKPKPRSRQPQLSASESLPSRVRPDTIALEIKQMSEMKKERAEHSLVSLTTNTFLDDTTVLNGLGDTIGMMGKGAEHIPSGAWSKLNDMLISKLGKTLENETRSKEGLEETFRGHLKDVGMKDTGERGITLGDVRSFLKTLDDKQVLSASESLSSPSPKPSRSRQPDLSASESLPSRVRPDTIALEIKQMSEMKKERAEHSLVSLTTNTFLDDTTVLNGLGDTIGMMGKGAEHIPSGAWSKLNDVLISKLGKTLENETCSNERFEEDFRGHLKDVGMKDTGERGVMLGDVRSFLSTLDDKQVLSPELSAKLKS